ncbi:MAG: DUF4367 domain-containing protein [Ruminiclostridium sp.]
MDKSYSVGDLISLYYEREFESIVEAALPVFSSKHKKKMEKIFKVFERNNALSDNNITVKPIRPLSVRQKIVLVIIIIILMTIATGCVIAFISNSFGGTVYNDNTYIFAFDIGNSPTEIEEEYTLSIVPEGYELYKTSQNSSCVFATYKNAYNKELVFTQTVKKEFYSHINTEGFTIEEFVVDNCDAICVEYERGTGTNSLVVWNNDEYILELYGNFTKQELIDLAICNEIKGF